ncbi:MAG: hypothetical protein EU529_06290 [Promethearchaeota archaeon]|nr:MAG: hypothetical protein EU529_06290 [Candidatus Lokiarchaeota archaeon]
MSEKSVGFNSDEKLEEISRFYRHKLPFTFKSFMKDIEITKKEFFLLFLIFNSLVFLGLYQFGIIIGMPIEHENPHLRELNLFKAVSIFSGFIIGFLLSIYFIDKIKKPISFIKSVIVTSLILIFIQIPLILLKMEMLLNIFYFTNILILIIAIMTTGKIFLIKTSILERGRIMSYLLFFTILCIAIVLGSALINILIIIPIVFVVLTIILLKINKDKYNIKFQTSIIEGEKKSLLKSFQLDLIKYYLFFFCFSFTGGLAFPLQDSIQFGVNALAGNTVLIFSLVIIYAIIIVILIGLLFDYAGRIFPLNYIILAIALATYIHIFRDRYYDFPLAIVFSAYIAALMCVPLLIGDTITRENFGSSLSISYFIIIIGMIIGLSFNMFITESLESSSFKEIFLMGTIFMFCIICLLFLVYMRETLPRKEQAWKNFLHHLYIIHDSGILLYEYAFIKEKQTEGSSVDSDLRAGGIIGVRSILKEIVQGEEEVKTIDSGDRVLMINHSNQVIFALIIKEELIVLRKKMEALIEDFNKEFGELINEVSSIGAAIHKFKPTEHIVLKYFGN